MELLKLFHISIIFAVILNGVHAYKILVIFPTPSFSHQRPQHAISKALAARGHELVIISPDPFETKNPNVTQIDCHFLYDQNGAGLQEMAVKEQTPWDMLEDFIPIGNNTIDQIFSMKLVQEVLNPKKGTKPYDAVVIENLTYSAIRVVAIKLDTALIGITSLPMFPPNQREMGNTDHALIHPSVMFDVPKHPNFFERVWMIINYFKFSYWMNRMEVEQGKLIKKYFPELKIRTDELRHRVDFAIEVMSPVFENVRPILPNTKQIGLVHMDEHVNPLPADLQKYLDSSTRGIVYVSFGSNVKSINIGPHIMNVLLTVLGSLDYDVLWKYENDTMPNKPQNVRIMKWTPQPDLLAHKNIKVFITQGGLQSMDESVYRGVPLVVIPFFGDQEFNAGKIQRLGIGIKIKKAELTVNRFRDAINEVITNPSYKQRVLELKKRALDMPMPPAVTAAWWIEYAIRNRGAEHLKYIGRDFPFYQYYFLDIAAAAVSLVLLVFYVFLMLMRKINPNTSNRKLKKN